MNFHLQFSIPNFSTKIHYSHSVFFVGSCFAENVGEAMKRYKFNVVINPNGILYNPISISRALRSYINKDFVSGEDLFYEHGCWNSWEHHSQFSNIDKEKCLLGINSSINHAHEKLKNAEWLFITFGSAFIYENTASKQFVANCHKKPQKQFKKHLLTTNEIVEEYKTLIQELKQFNKQLKIVFTISPVRYVRDGVVENNLSKAKLIDSVHQLVEQNFNTYYFPAYELVIDDLRDYRFYKKDLVHPNEQAIEYVFNKLVNSLFDEETLSVFEKVKEIITAKEHRPFNIETEQYKKFKATYLERCNQLQKQYSFLDLEQERLFFN